MEKIIFDGQQADERILYVIAPHPLNKKVALVKNLALALFFVIILFLVASFVTQASTILQASGIIIAILIMAVGTWWNNLIYREDRTYLTDRRIIRFEVVTPFFKTKRALFWSEAMKAKGFAPNLIAKYLKIGTIIVEPQLADHENVIVNNVYYFEDLANYIDKILFVFKNKPDEINQIKPFVPKPKGQRD